MPKAKPLLLDLYPNASVAYSLRKLRTAYTGNCIRVRRSSDNTEQNIGFVGNDLDTTSLLSFVGAGNGFVTTWYDQSGNGINANIATASFQARIVNNGSLEIDSLTNKISPLWNGYYNFSPRSLNQTFYATTVYTRLLTNDQMLILGQGTAGLKIYQWLSNGNTISEITPSNIITHQSAVTSTGSYILTALRDSSNLVKAYKNNNALTSGTDSGVNINVGTWGRLGSFITRGRMCELIFWNNNQENNRTGIETNVNEYYAIY